MKKIKSTIITLAVIIIASLAIIGFSQYSLYNLNKNKTKFPLEEKINYINKTNEISKLRARAHTIIELEETRMESEKALAEVTRFIAVSIIFFSLILLFELNTKPKDSNKSFKRDAKSGAPLN